LSIVAKPAVGADAATAIAELALAEPDPAEHTSTAHTAELTGLRGLAAAWVFAYHLWQSSGSPLLKL